jgi:hypothetical protein
VLGGGLYLQNKKHTADEQAHSFTAKQEALPQIAVSEEDKDAVDTIELSKPPKEDEEKAEEQAADAGAAADKGDKAEEAPARESVTLSKKGEEEWDITAPVAFKANAGNVKSLLDNLEKLKLVEEISSSADDYDKWGLSDEKALHAVFKKGEEVVLDLYVGDSGSRGQMVRLGGKTGVYAVNGFSKYLYERETKNWRDKGIFKFDDKDIEKVSVTNENGVFDFEKADGEWKATHAAKAGAPGSPIERFKASKVDDLIRAYKSLNASDFGDDKKPADVGLEPPLATVTLEAKGGSAKYVLFIGDNSKGEARWAKTATGDQIYSVSSWTANWATAEASKFQEKEPKKDDAKKDEAKNVEAKNDEG